MHGPAPVVEWRRTVVRIYAKYLRFLAVRATLPANACVHMTLAQDPQQRTAHNTEGNYRPLGPHLELSLIHISEPTRH
eukprot:12300912-Karenia_brevis.AAC.1